MKKSRSPSSILSSPFSLKSWLTKTPSPEEARPAHCPGCGVASRPVAGPLNLEGHGQRERQVRGPLELGQPPLLVVLPVRRYRCRCCGATMTVGPIGLRAGLLFSVAVVALALYLWGTLRQPLGQVCAQVNPWRRSAEQTQGGWRQVGRWARRIATGRLFTGLLPGCPPPGLRAVAQQAAAAWSARCPPQLCQAPMPVQVFAGAAPPA